MARIKEYKEEEVIEKAMHLFWRKGYQATSMQMLEREMGINKFSIYASFGSKKGVFLESLKCYKAIVNVVLEKLKKSSNGVDDIKQFFHDSVSANYKDNEQKGCFVTNTYNEFSESEDVLLKEQMQVFMDSLKQIFIEKLRMDGTKTEDQVLKYANFLLLAKHGLAAASRVNSKEEIDDYIEMLFTKI